MKKFSLIAFLCTIITSVIFISCSKDDGGDGNNTFDCSTTNITVSATSTNVVPCQTPVNNGTVTVAASGSTGFTYRIDGGAFTSVNVFTSVSQGNHTITAKDLNGCTKDTVIVVGLALAGPQLTAMKNLVTTRCSGSGCHINGQSGGQLNLDNDCSIVNAWSDIQRECINMNSMPKAPQAPLVQGEKNVITNWISGGHGYTN